VLKGRSLILLAFVLPLALYLLALGHLNRRRRPLLVSGTWDLIGLLAALSGFLLFGGPAVLSGLHERWRLFWLFGQADYGGDTGWFLWVILFGLYFVAVVGGAGYLFRQRRHLTCVYNVEPAVLELVLNEVCEQFGLEPVRSGNLLLFGLSLDIPAARAPSPEGIQAPHHLPVPASSERLTTSPRPPAPGAAVPTDELLGQGAILEIDAFRLLRHVTLRWDPADSPLRPEIEAELARRLAHAPAPAHETGAWMTLVGLTLLAGSLLGALFLMLRWFLHR
jgi:hypothetical protein